MIPVPEVGGVDVPPVLGLFRSNTKIISSSPSTLSFRLRICSCSDSIVGVVLPALSATAGGLLLCGVMFSVLLLTFVLELADEGEVDATSAGVLVPLVVLVEVPITPKSMSEESVVVAVVLAMSGARLVVVAEVDEAVLVEVSSARAKSWYELSEIAIAPKARTVSAAKGTFVYVDDFIGSISITDYVAHYIHPSVSLR